jgi:hypothetical protein
MPISVSYNTFESIPDTPLEPKEFDGPFSIYAGYSL